MNKCNHLPHPSIENLSEQKNSGSRQPTNSSLPVSTNPFYLSPLGPSSASSFNAGVTCFFTQKFVTSLEKTVAF